MLKDKFVHKSESDINRTLSEIKAGFVDDWMWARIIERMYEEQDCLILEEMFHDIVRERVESGFAEAGEMRFDNMGKLSREEKLKLLSSKYSKKLLWVEFVKTVMDF